MVAGIGCRSGVTEEEVEAALAVALRQNAPDGVNLTLIATATAKRGEAALMAVAKARCVPLLLIEQPALEAASDRALTRSERSMAAMNVHSVAEAAALAGAEAAAQVPRGTAASGRAAPIAPGQIASSDRPSALIEKKATAVATTKAATQPDVARPGVALPSRTDRPTYSRLLGPRVVVGPVTCALATRQLESN